MKTITRAITPLFLVALILTSCNSFAMPPAISPTAVSTVKAIVVETQAAIPTTTSSPQPPTPIPPLPTPVFSFQVDRHDPESVIRAYFDAWERYDGSAMAALIGQSNIQIAFHERIDSILVLEIKLISSPSQTERIYSVTFDIQQEGANSLNGQVEWTFTMMWDSNRDSWFIANHGVG